MINLIPEEFKLKKRYKKRRRLSVYLLIFLIFISAANYNILSNRLDYTKKKVNIIEEKLGYLQSVIDIEEEVNLLSEEIESRRSKVKSIGATPLHFNIIANLNLLIPEGVWLSQFIIDRGDRVQIRGQAVDNNKVVKALDRFSKQPYFDEMEIETINRLEGGRIYFYSKGRFNYGF